MIDSNHSHSDAPQVVAGQRGDYAAYPRSETHFWSMFAMVAVEGDGYGGLEAVNPGNGATLYVGAKPGTDFNQPFDIYGQLRRLVDAMERARFLGPRDGEPDSDQDQQVASDRHEQATWRANNAMLDRADGEPGEQNYDGPEDANRAAVEQAQRQALQDDEPEDDEQDDSCHCGHPECGAC